MISLRPQRPFCLKLAGSFAGPQFSIIDRHQKEAWAAACVAVETVTTQLATVKRCKGKAEIMKASWKGFI